MPNPPKAGTGVSLGVRLSFGLSVRCKHPLGSWGQGTRPVLAGEPESGAEGSYRVEGTYRFVVKGPIGLQYVA